MKGRLQELWILMMADRRKAGALIVLGVVLVALMGRGMLLGGPRAASGATGDGSENNGAGVGGGAVTLDELTKDGPTVRIPAPRATSRNVFSFDQRHFPGPESGDSSEIEQKSDLEQVESPRDDGRAHAERMARLVREEAESLRLKSTLMGPNPMAVIESGAKGRRWNRTMRVGDSHDGFVVVSIESSRVVLEKHGVRVELER